MCTAVTYNCDSFFFGRNLDYEFSYGEHIVFTPRNFPLSFRYFNEKKNHYAMLGVACISDNYPLYYDAVNENGLCMAGLNFVNSAYYPDVMPEKNNAAPFEMIPLILSSCKDVSEACELLKNLNIADIDFSDKLPAANLHWIIADKNSAVTVEPLRGGLAIYENQAGVLANDPPFDIQMFNLNNYMHLSAKSPNNSFSKKLDLKAYSRGMGGLGLPGDLSSQSRFVRAAFTKLNSVSSNKDEEGLSQIFHILGSVEQQRGCCDVGDGQLEMTIYTSCCNADKGIYYYTTYENRQITRIDMHKENLDGDTLVVYPFIRTQQIKNQN
ncbi:MAG: choloylglycine hydrolase [Acutalibacteraceae bacterium]|nr:choloylglycine hydrolase [Acutalibacteraceae bacterium]